MKLQCPAIGLPATIRPLQAGILHQRSRYFVKIKSRPLNWLLAAAVVSACRLLFCTLRIRYIVGAPNTNPYDQDCTEGFIYCVWHDAIAYPMFAGRHWHTVALVSKNIDGSHLARGLRMLHIGLVRGSSSRHGAAAIREILRLPRNTHLVLTPDGPRGPRRKTKAGMVFIAAHSGRSIVPTAFAAVRAWKIRGSWTTLSIPKPFTTVFALSGVPVAVPANSTAVELAFIEGQVQSEMDRLSEEADRLCGGEVGAKKP
ncbi:MAG: DUF374 domain-containing protein [Pirellulales bacterium]|nr:DUF374 domain-containing protein [Pirellulales bacterium]